MPDVPIGPIGDAIGQAIGSVAATAFDSAMKSLWDFSISLLGGVFGVVDHLTTPNLDPRSGPLASVLPATLWIGGVLLLLLSFLQIGKAAMTGGSGLLHLVKGIGQYLVVTAGGLGVLAAAVAAANAAALGLLDSGLHVTSWQGITTSNSAWQNSVNAVSGAGLGLIALLGVLPAAISLLLAVLVREAAILVIAATIPIVAAGLVAEATARWFWTAVRWLLALVLLTPVVAIVMALGLHLAAGAAGGGSTSAAADAGQSAVTAFVGAGVLLVSVFCPLALFKLLAFVDPGTASGQRLRTSLSDAGVSGASSTSSGGGLAASSGSTPEESATSDQVETRWGNALGRLSAAHATLGSAAQRTMSTAAPVLAAAGVGEGIDHDSAAGDVGMPPRHARPESPAAPGPTPPAVEPPGPPDIEPPTPGAGSSPGAGAAPVGGMAPAGAATGGAAPASGAAGTAAVAAL